MLAILQPLNPDDIDTSRFDAYLVEDTAKRIFEKCQELGIEEFSTDPWELASDKTKRMYLKIAEYVLQEL